MAPVAVVRSRERHGFEDRRRVHSGEERARRRARIGVADEPVIPESPEPLGECRDERMKRQVCVPSGEASTAEAGVREDMQQCWH